VYLTPVLIEALLNILDAFTDELLNIKKLNVQEFTLSPPPPSQKKTLLPICQFTVTPPSHWSQLLYKPVPAGPASTSETRHLERVIRQV
jgi:hypothetical protein